MYNAEKQARKPQIEGLIQKKKPGNNHTHTAYNKTIKTKKSLETMSKLHQEHSKMCGFFLRS